MTPRRIARRYAKALFRMAEREGKVDEFLRDLEAFAGLWETEELLRRVLSTPTIPRDRRAAILGDIARRLALSPEVRSFLGVLMENNRMDAMEAVLEIYRDLRDQKMGILRGVLVVPMEVTQDQLGKVTKALGEATGKKVLLEVRVDPEVLGGARVEVGGVVYDGSLKAQLRRFRETLLEG